MTAAAHALLLDIPERLETANLTLAATRAGMGAVVHEGLLESMEELKRWMPWARVDQVLEQTEIHTREAQAKWHSRLEIDFCFFRRDDASFVGKGGLHTIDWSVPKFEVGYWIRSSCSGRGIATEATAALVALGRDHLGAKRIELACDAKNAPSRRVAEKSGFTLEGIHRHARRDNAGELADKCMYAITFP
ncbi:MAG TPA: GNAT family protein [Usitatibacter sp.]|nr:GNAT family protein [Usitatibacter sp.]